MAQTSASPAASPAARTSSAPADPSSTTLSGTGTGPTGPTGPTGLAQTPRRPALLLALVLIGQFMALLDVAIVNVAAPTIRTDLHAEGSSLQLAISGYTITYAVLLITGARLGERWGFDRVFQAGIAVFTVSSLACGLAPDTGSLIGFRLLQGVGAALMVPQVMSLLQRTFTGAARVRALGAYVAVLASGMVLGQVLGGLLVTANLFGSGWRPVFLINVPIGLALLVVGNRVLPSYERVHRALDLRGLVLLSAAVLLLVVPLVLGHDQGWPLHGWLMMAASVLCLIAFVLVERRIAGNGGAPLIHGRVLAAPGLLAAVGSIFLIMAGVAGFMFAFALHLQSGLGESALRVGLTFAPMALAFGLAGLWWRRLPARLHRRIPLPALLLCAVGYLVVGLSVSHGHRIGLALELVMLAMGALTGCGYGQLFASALSGVRVQDAADASGVVVTLIQLGNVIGVSVFGTIFLSALHTPLTPAGSGHAAGLTVYAVAAATAAAALISLLRPRTGQV